MMLAVAISIHARVGLAFPVPENHLVFLALRNLRSNALPI
jgi:hypothetical protein